MAIYGDYQDVAGNLALDSNQFKRDVVKKLLYLEPELNPLTVLMRHPKARKDKAKSFKHEWAETDDMALFTQINNSGGYNTTDTDFILDDSSIVGITSILVNQRTGETYRVTANNTGTNTITVSRSWGGTAAATINDNDYLSILGTAAVAGADSQVGQVVNESWKFNYVQEFRDPFGATWMAQASENYHGPLLARRRAERMRDHKKKLEMAMFYGERNQNSGGDEGIHSMGGIYEWISTNVKSFGGLPTFDEMVVGAEDLFEYGAATKYLFCGKSGFTRVAQVATDTIRSGKVADTLGLNLSKLELQHGSVVLHKHLLFRGNEFAKRGFVLDLNKIVWAPMQKMGDKGGDTTLRQDLQSNSATADKEEWYTCGTLRREQEECHAVWDDLSN